MQIYEQILQSLPRKEQETELKKVLRSRMPRLNFGLNGRLESVHRAIIRDYLKKLLGVK